MSGLNSYSQIPNIPIAMDNGMIDPMWHLFLSNIASGVSPVTRIQPVTGFNFTVPDGIVNLIIDPAGVLANGALVMPSSPKDGQECEFTSSQNITACTFSGNAGQTVVNAPSSMTAGVSVKFIFSQGAATWYKK